MYHPAFRIDAASGMAHPSGSSSVRRDLNQSLVATGVDPCQNPLTTYAVASSLQASEFREVSLGFHQPVSVRRLPSITEHSAVTLSAPSLYQTSVTNREDFCLSQVYLRGFCSGAWLQACPRYQGCQHAPKYTSGDPGCWCVPKYISGTCVSWQDREDVPEKCGHWSGPMEISGGQWHGSHCIPDLCVAGVQFMSKPQRRGPTFLRLQCPVDLV